MNFYFEFFFKNIWHFFQFEKFGFPIEVKTEITEFVEGEEILLSGVASTLYVSGNSLEKTHFNRYERVHSILRKVGQTLEKYKQIQSSVSFSKGKLPYLGTVTSYSSQMYGRPDLILDEDSPIYSLGKGSPVQKSLEIMIFQGVNRLRR